MKLECEPGNRFVPSIPIEDALDATAQVQDPIKPPYVVGLCLMREERLHIPCAFLTSGASAAR